MKVRYLGMPGHFIGASRCVWHLTSVVGPYLVSTLGDYRPFPSDEATNIGAGRKYETMVFKAGAPCTVDGCGCGVPNHNGREIDFAPYNTAGEAQAGHEAMVAKYVERAKETS